MLARLVILSYLIVTPVASSFASEDCPPQEGDLAALKALLMKNPEILARHEAGEARPRFFAVMGYGATLPGLDDDPGKVKCLLTGASTMPMPGTSDVLCSAEIVKLQPIAAQFAKRYNRALAQAMDMNCI